MKYYFKYTPIAILITLSLVSLMEGFTWPGMLNKHVGLSLSTINSLITASFLYFIWRHGKQLNKSLFYFLFIGLFISLLTFTLFRSATDKLISLSMLNGYVFHSQYLVMSINKISIFYLINILLLLAINHDYMLLVRKITSKMQKRYKASAAVLILLGALIAVKYSNISGSANILTVIFPVAASLPFIGFCMYLFSGEERIN